MQQLHQYEDDDNLMNESSTSTIFVQEMRDTSPVNDIDSSTTVIHPAVQFNSNITGTTSVASAQRVPQYDNAASRSGTPTPVVQRIPQTNGRSLQGFGSSTFTVQQLDGSTGTTVVQRISPINVNSISEHAPSSTLVQRIQFNGNPGIRSGSPTVQQLQQYDGDPVQAESVISTSNVPVYYYGGAV